MGCHQYRLKKKSKKKNCRKNKLKKRSESADYTGRKYDDYIEFAKPQLFEVNTETGEIRSKIFYCDAQMPSQKPHVENNHEFIRDIILKKKSMSNLTQDKLDLMFSHINSVPRKSLGGKTPYEAFEFFYGKDTLDKLNIQKIKEDEVTLKPYLLQL